ncbi:MAG: hypothetical protein RBU25_00910 [Lentisphaeria bacterium]|jgi:hypothetical protein|nr:hypothetical protein [Lentisphaeria bacterium]
MSSRPTLIPMAAMTGQPDRALIHRRLRQYHELGIDQFLVYPRSGCEVPYMSEAWFELCEHVCEAAERYDMAVWLYDEFNWPSGGCGGQVLDGHPELAALRLEGHWRDGQLAWQVRARNPWVNLLDPAAVERFRTLTHERYAARLGRFLGTRLKGIFTDEPSYMYAIHHADNPAADLELGYYQGIEEDYAARTGRVFRADAEQAMRGEPVPDLWPTYHGLLGERFHATFFAPLTRWCTEHGLLHTGHLMCETPPYRAVTASGRPLECLTALSLPGIDEISTRTAFAQVEWGTHKLAQYAMSRQKRGGLAEVFALGPPDMPFGKLRQMLWLTALHGVDHHVLAVSPLDARGNLLKRAYFTAFTPIQPWFKQLAALAADSVQAGEIARLGLAPGVAVRFPWRLACEDVAHHARKAWREPRSGQLHQITMALLRDQWPVRLIGEEETPPAGTIATCSVGEDTLRIEFPGGSAEEAPDAAALVARLAARATRPVRLTRAGEPVPDVFVETLADGRCALLNLCENDYPGCQLAFASGQSIRLDLPSRGLRIVAKTAAPDPACLPLARAPETLRFNLCLDRANLLCCRPTTAGGNEFVFTVDAPLAGLRLLVRDDTVRNRAAELDDQVDPFAVDASLVGQRRPVREAAQAGPVELDGQPVELVDPCIELPEGMAEFYRVSRRLHLAPGRHVVRLLGTVDDAPYLPALFVAGDMGVFPGARLAALPATVGLGDLRGCGLLHYAGKVVLSGTLSLPTADALDLDTGEHLARLRLAGRDLGERLWAPFRWHLPAELPRRPVGFELTLTTSIGAIFGTKDAVPPGGLAAFWAGQHAPLGILAQPVFRHTQPNL